MLLNELTVNQVNGYYRSMAFEAICNRTYAFPRTQRIEVQLADARGGSFQNGVLLVKEQPIPIVRLPRISVGLLKQYPNDAVIVADQWTALAGRDNRVIPANWTIDHPIVPFASVRRDIPVHISFASIQANDPLVRFYGAKPDDVLIIQPRSSYHTFEMERPRRVVSSCLWPMDAPHGIDATIAAMEYDLIQEFPNMARSCARQWLEWISRDGIIRSVRDVDKESPMLRMLQGNAYRNLLQAAQSHQTDHLALDVVRLWCGTPKDSWIVTLD